MNKLTYLSKIRNRAGKINGYYMMDNEGRIGSINAGSLKEAIRLGEIIVDNLKLTSDGRLIGVNKVNNKNSSNELKNLIERSKVIGWEVKRLESSGGQVILIQNEHENILYIPDNIEELNSTRGEELTSKINGIKGKIKVLGGRGLNSTKAMFEYTKFSDFDLSKFEANGIRDMTSMFEASKADSINISGLDTSRVVSMMNTFSSMYIKELDLSGFDMSKVINASGIFMYSNIIKLKLNGLNLSNAKQFRNAFFGTNIIEDLDMSTLKISEDCDVRDIFKNSSISKLTLNEKQHSLIREAKRNSEGIKNLEIVK